MPWKMLSRLANLRGYTHRPSRHGLALVQPRICPSAPKNRSGQVCNRGFPADLSAISEPKLVPPCTCRLRSTSAGYVYKAY